MDWESDHTDPSLFTFPQVQPNGDIFQNWFDVILNKPSGLTCASFKGALPVERMSELWRY